jgi:AcrR family transcriptional regulator
MQETENPKFQQIVSTARNLFTRFGTRRVSIEEVCREAGVSKMTFYKYFRNKTELVQFILNQIAQQALDRYNGIMEQDVPYSEKVKQIIQMKLDQTEGLTTEFIKDFVNNAEPEIAEWYQRMVQERMMLFLNHLRQAQRDGSIRSDLNPEFIVYIMNRMIEMTYDDNLVRLYESPKALTAELMNFLFYGMLPRTKGEF